MTPQAPADTSHTGSLQWTALDQRAVDTARVLLELEDLKVFRTWGSLTPGHPEHGHTTGVETTTGPLGQGIANAVGMAMAARYERGLFDPEAAAGASPFDHTIRAIVSDGDLEEGVPAEASSLAGHQKPGNLVALYDDNHISIEGDTETAFSEDVLKRYEAYGWHVQRIEQNTDGDFGSPSRPANSSRPSASRPAWSPRPRPNGSKSRTRGTAAASCHPPSRPASPSKRAR